MREITLDLGDRSYRVIVGQNAREALPQILIEVRSKGSQEAQSSKGTGGVTVLVTDETVNGLYGEVIASIVGTTSDVARIVVPPTESSKSMEWTNVLLEKMAGANVKRNDVLVALGGGMVTDLGGFVASIYQRGIASINIPTTLLGQVDAAIGGKTGVNLTTGKNLSGTFWHPRAVIADTTLLQTLPDAEFVSGLAEVVKYGLCFDPDLLSLVEERAGDLRKDLRLLDDVVSRSVAHKVRLVAMDERDEGERMLLNYGHTLGHALEAYGNYERWTHGEAISVGMVFAAVLSNELGVLGTEAVERHERVLSSVGLPTKAEFEPRELERFLILDKKHTGRQRWIILKEIGEPVIEAGVDDEVFSRSLERVRL